MLAIAGAKGGCGKTTTTLGLTEALARSGVSAVAVDADRQLPNLHVTGGIEREPTLAALEAPLEADGRPERTDVETVAQESPRTADAGILPAPAPAETLDVASALADVADADAQSIVDCPSGAGPDAVDPVSVADGVIVVTTDDDRSINAAETTVQMAHRLETPVIGVVVNRCESVPDAIDSWLEVPVLGTVPESDDPLTADATRHAYERIAETLQTRNAAARTPRDDLLATGVGPLDRWLGGGLRPGTLAALVADPATQSEQCLYEMTAPRGTLYIATERTAANVRRAVDNASVETGTPTIRHVGGEDAIAEAETLLEGLPDGATLLVDPAVELERRGRQSYVAFLNELAERLAETGSIGILHCLSRPTPPANRPATIHAADAVFELRTRPAESVAAAERSSGESQRLSVTKFRADASMTGEVDIAFGDRRPLPIESSPE